MSIRRRKMKSGRSTAHGLIRVVVCVAFAGGCGSSPSGRQSLSAADGGAGSDGASWNDEGGSDSSADSASIPSIGQTPSPMYVPSVNGTCPTMTTGNVVFSGQTWQLWAGTPTADQHGAVVIYWHGTGWTCAEPTFPIRQAEIDAIPRGG